MMNFIVWTYVVSANNVYIQYAVPAFGILMGLTLLVDWVLAVDKVVPFFQKYTKHIYVVAYPMVFFICMSGISFLFGFAPNLMSEYWIGVMVTALWFTLAGLIIWGIIIVLCKVRELAESRK